MNFDSGNHPVHNESMPRRSTTRAGYEIFTVRFIWQRQQHVNIDSMLVTSGYIPRSACMLVTSGKVLRSAARHHIPLGSHLLLVR